MFVLEGHYTHEVGSHVSQSIVELLVTHPQEVYVNLTVDQTIPGVQQTIPTIFKITLNKYWPTPIFVLANDQELVRCITLEGHPLDIIMGVESDREYEPCLVLATDEAFADARRAEEV